MRGTVALVPLLFLALSSVAMVFNPLAAERIGGLSVSCRANGSLGEQLEDAVNAVALSDGAIHTSNVPGSTVGGCRGR